MIKRIIFSIAILLFATNIFATNSTIDTSYTDGITAFDWSPISDVEKILQYENQKDISKRTIDQANKAKDHLKRKGVTVYVEQTKVRDRTWFRLMAGPIESQTLKNWKAIVVSTGHKPLVYPAKD